MSSSQAHHLPAGCLCPVFVLMVTTLTSNPADAEPCLAPASQGLAKSCGMPFEDGEAGAIKLCSLISIVIICSLQTSETHLHPFLLPAPGAAFRNLQRDHSAAPNCTQGVNSCPLPRFISPGWPCVPQKLLCCQEINPSMAFSLAEGSIILGNWATEAEEKAQFSLEIMELKNDLG